MLEMALNTYLLMVLIIKVRAVIFKLVSIKIKWF